MKKISDQTEKHLYGAYNGSQTYSMSAYWYKFAAQNTLILSCENDMIKENSIQSVKIIGTDKTELIGEKVIHKIDFK